MINTFYGANLIDYNNCNVAIFSTYSKPDKTPIKLIINNKRYVNLEIKKQVFLNGLCLYTCFFEEGFVLGNDYQLFIENFGTCNLNVSGAIDFPDFDERYYYPFNDLGVTYSKERTTFKLWAPLASNVEIYLKKDIHQIKEEVYSLSRDQFGVYSIEINEDLEGYIYRYKVRNSGKETFTTDPYGKASIANGVANVVIDFNKTKIDLNEDDLPYYENYTDTIIYELSVRDFSMDQNAPFKNKGKYLAFTEEGLKTKAGNPCGIDYLADLGITHVQILPMYDFKTVNELNPLEKYNWGYDPQQYFVPEGSFALDPNDPYSRIIECKKMIASLHAKKLKVNMDVVYNHVYEYLSSSFENVVPGYYFRKTKTGTISNGSGCGNDFASERSMVRKLIVDCCRFWIKEYGIDGLRFDLMGLIDVKTINQVTKMAQSIKPDFMVYGEGWDMTTNLESGDKASILNSFKMPQVAFFNDTYRDILKGQNGVEQLKTSRGYLTGNLSYVEGFKFVYLSSSTDFIYPKRFISPNQSINYVECHDNFTLFDKVSSLYGHENNNVNYPIINMINAIILSSFGVPFFHAGQEFGATKKYEDNTYNMSDEYNMIHWDLVDKNIEMVNYFKSFINFRKDYSDLRSADITKINSITSFKNVNNQLLEIGLKLNDQEIFIVLNPTDSNITYELKDYVVLVCGEAGYIPNSVFHLKTSLLKKHTLYVYKKEAVL